MADPAFRGFVESTLDALLIFEGCRRGLLPKITRRLQEFEKRALVASGAVFVFDEEETGIKRWTDGLTWSPSRTLGNFLVYRELDKKAAPNTLSGDEHGTASGAVADPYDDTMLPSAELAPVASTSAGTGAPAASSSLASPRRRSPSESTQPAAAPPSLDRHRERALVGSLTSSYRFRADGLVKKTISLSGLHMIGYYKIEDVTSGRLRVPSSHAELIVLDISSTFLTPSFFRIPPLVEAGEDGQLHYKGEPDTPMSPLTRSGSSQGFGTPALGTTRSRPPSSESVSTPGRTASPRLPSLAASTQRDPPLPGSPHRASISLRSSNRFDPYSVGRSSPSMSSLGQSSNGYPFPTTGQQSPDRTTIGPLSHDESFRGGEGTPLSPLQLPAMSSSAPPNSHHWGAGPSQPQPGQHHAVQLSRSAVSDQSGFYQPRHPLPFVPSDAPPTNSNIFAYHPPPPSRTTRSERDSPPVPYPLYPPQTAQLTPPLPPPQQQMRQASSQYPPSYSLQGHPPPPSPRAYSLPVGSSSPYLAERHDEPTPYVGHGGNPVAYGDRPSSSTSYSEHPSTAAYERPSAHQHADMLPSPHQQQAYYQVLTQPPYPAYSLGGSSSHPYHQRSYQDPPPRLPSGMVMGAALEQDDDPRQQHQQGHVGLGLGQERLDRRDEQPLLRTIKREPQSDQWWSGPLAPQPWESNDRTDYPQP